MFSGMFCCAVSVLEKLHSLSRSAKKTLRETIYRSLSCKIFVVAMEGALAVANYIESLLGSSHKTVSPAWYRSFRALQATGLLAEPINEVIAAYFSLSYSLLLSRG